MRKRAFTLIELLISVILLGLIVNFLYSAVANLQKTNLIFYKKSNELQNSQRLLDLIYDDIFLAKSIKISGLKNSALDLQTSNSIFDIEYPYVSWILSPENNTLVRFESVLEFKKMNSDNNHLFHITKIAKDCQRFHIYQSKDNKNVLIDIKFKDQERLVYEFYKDMNSTN